MISSVDMINSDVRACVGDTGMISATTRETLENEGIYTVEIKSSLLQDPRDYKSMAHKLKGERTGQDYEILCTYIKGFYDYFVYPHFCRSSNSITNFYRYTQFVRNSYDYNDSDKRAFLYQLMKDEFDNACLLYTRVFFDVISDEIIIPGYVLKTRFFEEPRIQKMPSMKSRNAIYYMYHMNLGKSFIDIDQDDELIRYNRLNAYQKLLGCNQERCERCGCPLKLVESVRNGKFLYLCENCQTQKWFTMNQIHTNNMSE